MRRTASDKKCSAVSASKCTTNRLAAERTAGEEGKEKGKVEEGGKLVRPQ